MVHDAVYKQFKYYIFFIKMELDFQLYFDK